MDQRSLAHAQIADRAAFGIHRLPLHNPSLAGLQLRGLDQIGGGISRVPIRVVTWHALGKAEERQKLQSNLACDFGTRAGLGFLSA